MSEEEKVIETADVKELEATIASLKGEIEKLKQANSNASSDAADWKRKYRETLDEAERKKQETEEAISNMQSQLEAYKTNERIASYTTKLIEAGFDADTAKSMANVLPEGVGDEFFTSQKSFLENQKLKVKQESLNSQPSLTQGMPMSGKTAEQLEEENMRRWMGLPPK